MTEHIMVDFAVGDGKIPEFDRWLQHVTNGEAPLCIEGYRANDFVQRRDALRKFADQMETVLRAHDHKTSWRERPIEALVKLLMLEIEEFKVALEHFEVSDARKELIDAANFCLIVLDRLGMLDQNRSLKTQTT